MPVNGVTVAKTQCFNLLAAIAGGADPGVTYHDEAKFWCSRPFNQAEGIDAVRRFWSALRAALPDIERRDLIFVAGESAPDPRARDDISGRTLVAAMGHLQGTFTADFCGIPATHGVVHLRYCEAHHWRAGKIAQTWMLIDFLDLMRQAGVWPIASSLGVESMWPGPATCDGVRPALCDPERGRRAMDTVLAMHAALGTFDGRTIDSMSHAKYWADNFMWYGPAGIGAMRGMRGFRTHHQVPFLTGFPDRKGASHYVRIADGDYVVTGGWPSVEGTHTGEWLGLPGTGRRAAMRVMDFYRVDGEKIVENWVPIDIIDILYQLGFDVFRRLKHLRGDPRLDI